MSGIEGIDQIGAAAARIQIEEPAPNEANEIMAAVADARADLPKREPDALERQIAEGMEGDYSVEINGPDGTHGAEAIARVVEPLFDGSAYVAVPEVDGQTADKIVIAFSGSVAYDATDEQGAKLYEDLRLGKAVEMRVAGFVSGKAGGYTVTARDEEVVTGKATIKVDTMYLLTPENLA